MLVVPSCVLFTCVTARHGAIQICTFQHFESNGKDIVATRSVASLLTMAASADCPVAVTAASPSRNVAATISQEFQMNVDHDAQNARSLSTLVKQRMALLAVAEGEVVEHEVKHDDAQDDL